MNPSKIFLVGIGLLLACGDDSLGTDAGGTGLDASSDAVSADAVSADAVSADASVDAVSADAASSDAGMDASRPVDDLQTMLESITTTAPALGAAVVDAQGLRAIGATGIRRAGDATAVTAADRWHLGSCTKAMTASLIARLVEAGSLSWETTIADVYPSAEATPYAAVTLDELVAHRAGFVEQLPDAYWADVFSEGALPLQRRRIVDLVLGDAPVGTPGSTFLYSNVGFIVAGAMIEETHEAMTWESLMQAHVFAPLGMESCGFGSPDVDGMVDAPWGHGRGSGGELEASLSDNPPALGPAGTVHCSLADWAKFVRAHATRDPAFLSGESYSRMHSSLPGESYRAGWGVSERSWARGLTLSHSGSNTLNYALVWVAPNTGYAFLATANVADPETAVELDGIIGELINRYSL